MAYYMILNILFITSKIVTISLLLVHCYVIWSMYVYYVGDSLWRTLIILLGEKQRFSKTKLKKIVTDHLY